MADESKSYRDVVSRRRFVELTGVAGAAALAGCDGDGEGSPSAEETSESGMTGDETPTDGGDTTQPEYPNQRHNGVTTSNPSNRQFNITNGTRQPEISQWLLFERFAQYNFVEGGYVSSVVTDWEFTGDTFEMTIRDDMNWSNGEAVTSEDLRVQLELAIANEGTIASWAESVDTPDETTVVINVSSDLNPALIENDVFGGRWLSQDRFTYGSKLEEIQNGGEERLSEFRSFEDTEPITCGPFTLEERSDQAMLCSRFDGSPYASEINFGEYAFNLMDGNQARQQALVSLNVDSDFSLAAPARIVANFPGAVEEVRTPNVFGIGLTAQHDHSFAGDRAVRQAMAHVINRDRAVQNSYSRVKKTPEIPTAVATDVQERWLGDVMDQYETYGKGASQTDKATQVLQDAGYEKVDGTWQDGDGNTVSVPIKHPAGWTDWVLALESVVSDLNNFGFESELVGTDSYGTARAEGDFVFIAQTWLHGRPPAYPYYSLRHMLWEHEQHPTLYNYPPAKDTDQLGGSAEDLTVPARDGSGETTISIGDKVTQLQKATDDSEIQTHVRDLAWAANQDLPTIPVTEKLLQSFVTSDDWDIPTPLEDDTDANVQWPPTWLPRKGKMNYSGN